MFRYIRKSEAEKNDELKYLREKAAEKTAEDEKTACERVKECEDALCELAEMLAEVL